MFNVRQFDQALSRCQPPSSLQQYCQDEFTALNGPEKLHTILSGAGWGESLEIFNRGLERNWPTSDAQLLMLCAEKHLVTMNKFIEATCTVPLRKRQLLERFSSNAERNAQQFGTFLAMESFCNLPVSWGSVFQDDNGRFWANLRLHCNLAKPAGDLGQRPVLAWEAMTRAGVTLDAFLAALKAAHVGAYTQCMRSLETRTPVQPEMSIVPANVQWAAFWKRERQTLLQKLVPYLETWKAYHNLYALGSFPKPRQEDIMEAVRFLDGILGSPQHTTTFINAVEKSASSVPFWDAMRLDLQQAPLYCVLRDIVFQHVHSNVLTNEDLCDAYRAGKLELGAPVRVPIAPVAIDAMDGLESTAPDKWQLLRSKLGQAHRSMNAQAQDARIKSVLTNKDITDWVKKKLPWLLPDKSTLLGLVENGDAAWIDLVCIVVEYAERELRRTSLFPQAEPKRQLEAAVASARRAPILEELLYDPSMSADDRQQAWLACAGDVIDQGQLVEWLERDPQMAFEELHQDELNLMMRELMDGAQRNQQLRRKVIKAVQRKQPKFVVAQLDDLVQQLHPMPQNRGTVQPMNFTAAPWSVSGCLQKLGIQNAALQRELNTWIEQELFDSISKQKHLTEALREMGATATQAAQLSKELKTEKIVNF